MIVFMQYIRSVSIFKNLSNSFFIVHFFCIVNNSLVFLKIAWKFRLVENFDFLRNYKFKKFRLFLKIHKLFVNFFKSHFVNLLNSLKISLIFGIIDHKAFLSILTFLILRSYRFWNDQICRTLFFPCSQNACTPF